MEVKVETAGGKSYYAYPKMYVNSKTGQLMANPAIRSSAAHGPLHRARSSTTPASPRRSAATCGS